jgi:hypothetical protein
MTVRPLRASAFTGGAAVSAGNAANTVGEAKSFDTLLVGQPVVRSARGRTDARIAASPQQPAMSADAGQIDDRLHSFAAEGVDSVHNPSMFVSVPSIGAAAFREAPQDRTFGFSALGVFGVYETTSQSETAGRGRNMHVMVLDTHANRTAGDRDESSDTAPPSEAADDGDGIAATGTSQMNRTGAASFQSDMAIRTESDAIPNRAPTQPGPTETSLLDLRVLFSTASVPALEQDDSIASPAATADTPVYRMPLDITTPQSRNAVNLTVSGTDTALSITVRCPQETPGLIRSLLARTASEFRTSVGELVVNGSTEFGISSATGGSRGRNTR